METASEWRMRLARMIVARYAMLPDVEAAFVGGSTARGQSDRFSDVEVTIIWENAPTEEARAAVVSNLGGDLHRLYPYEAQWQLWEDVFFLGRDDVDAPKSGCQIEMSHYLRPTVETAMERVLVAFDPDPDLQNLMAGLLDGVPLLNAAVMGPWQERLREYPDGLQRAVIQRHGIIDHFWRWEMLLARGDNRLELANLFTRVLHEALHLLLGLNRVYYGGFKWLDTLIPKLTIAPTNLAERLRRVFVLPASEAAAEVAGIVGETFDLVERHVPGVDVARFRQIFTFQRPQWEGPPRGLPQIDAS